MEKIYGDLSVLPNGLETWLHIQLSGSVAYLIISSSKRTFRKQAISMKQEEKEEMYEMGSYYDEHRIIWSIFLMETGYALAIIEFIREQLSFLEAFCRREITKIYGLRGQTKEGVKTSYSSSLKISTLVWGNGNPNGPKISESIPYNRKGSAFDEIHVWELCSYSLKGTNLSHISNPFSDFINRELLENIRKKSLKTLTVRQQRALYTAASLTNTTCPASVADWKALTSPSSSN